VSTARSTARACLICGKTFAPRRAEAVYCSPACYRAAYDAALALADLETKGRVWGEGTERRARCPYCGDDHAQDRAHACLAVNADTGAWECHRCERRGRLREHWQAPRDEAAAEPAPTRRTKRSRRPPAPAAPPPPREPSPAELADAAERRARLRRMWGAAVPIDAPEAAPGAAYLEGRCIPLETAAAGRLRFARDWYGRPAVVAPVQGSDGRLVAAEGRYTDGGTNPKGRTTGPKGTGVFVATPGALDTNWPVLCEGPLTALSVAACGWAAVALCGQKWPPWLAARLAYRDVVVALDEGETKTEAAAAALVRELRAVGATPYRLRWAAGVDANDRLRAVGVAAMRAELYAAVGAAAGLRE